MAKKPSKAAETAPAAADDLDIARKIWLAGVGAYGRIYAEAQGQLGKITGNANDVFDNLVKQGEQVEHLVRARISTNTAAHKVADAMHQMQSFRDERRAEINQRVAAVRKAVTEAVAPYNPLTLVKTVEQLAAEVAELRAEVASLKRAKAPSRAPARQAAASPARRTKRA